MLRNSERRYGSVSKLLHWLIATSILGLIGLGWWMVGLSYYHPWYNSSLELHRSFGLLVLAFAVLLLGWKMVSPSPALQSELKAWERHAAHVVHLILILAMVVLPVSGYLISTSAGAGVSIFGLAEAPAVISISERLRDLAIEIHYYAAYATLSVIAVHAGAALKHQFVDKHGTLKRML